MFLINKRRSPDIQYWAVTLSNWQKQSPEVFYKETLKILQYSQQNTCVGVSSSTLLKKRPTQVFCRCEIFKNTHFEERLRAATSELTLEKDCLETCFGTAASKTILTRKYYKNTSLFQARALNTIRRICWLYIWHPRFHYWWLLPPFSSFTCVRITARLLWLRWWKSHQVASCRGITALTSFFPKEHMKFKGLYMKLAGWLDVFVFHIVFILVLKLFSLFFWMTKGS